MALLASLVERVGGCHADLYAPTNDRRIVTNALHREPPVHCKGSGFRPFAPLSRAALATPEDVADWLGRQRRNDNVIAVWHYRVNTRRR